jgi:cell division protein FtsL
VKRDRPTAMSVLWQLLPGALLAALFAAVGIVHVTSRVLVVDAGYRLSHEQSENQRLTLINDRLKLELATLKSPARLERIAKEHLQMGPPAANALIPIHPERSEAKSRDTAPAPRPPSGRAAPAPVRAANP